MLPDRALTGAEPDSVQITLLEATLHHGPDTSPSCGGDLHSGHGTAGERRYPTHYIFLWLQVVS